ncbi:hypothetical protein TacPo2_85 [Pantoea bacteriophage TacPo2]
MFGYAKPKRPKGILLRNIIKEHYILLISLTYIPY